MELLKKLAAMLGLATTSLDESDIETYGVGAVMPHDLTSLPLLESITRQ